MLSLANVDFDQIGRGVVAFFMFVVPLLSAFGIFAYLEKRVKSRKKKKVVKEVRLPEKEDDFFFGELKDVREFR